LKSPRTPMRMVTPPSCAHDAGRQWFESLIWTQQGGERDRVDSA
jgi:hypothetical protein